MNLGESLSVEEVAEEVSDTRLDFEDGLVRDGLRNSVSRSSQSEREETHSEVEDTVVETGVERDVGSLVLSDARISRDRHNSTLHSHQRTEPGQPTWWRRQGRRGESEVPWR